MIGDRTAPADLVRRLQEIVPNADLIYLGDGQWQLGYYQPENARIRNETARMALAEFLTKPESLQRAREIKLYRFILRTGFRTMGNPFEVNDPDTAGIDQVLERWEWIYRHQLEDAWEARLYEIDDERDVERAQAVMADKIDSEGESIFRHATYGPKAFSYPGARA
ncbi:MAG: hypothetical protein ACLFWG_09190 [Longimicrobiales bacterium]